MNTHNALRQNICDATALIGSPHAWLDDATNGAEDFEEYARDVADHYNDLFTAIQLLIATEQVEAETVINAIILAQDMRRHRT